MNTITKMIAALALAVTVTASANAGGASQHYTLAADHNVVFDVYACGTGKHIELSGDGTTDLDFEVRTVRGRMVFTDYDYTDYTSFYLPAYSDGSCRRYKLKVINLDEDIWNRFSFEETWA
jgi:hypothetical protein